VIKIFTGIRCLSKDQLPRYIDGRLTDVEKHLVEQHLADCDLCFGALQALEKAGNTDQYNDLTGKLQRYIEQSVRPVSQVQKIAQYTRKERTKENLLVYFWVLAFGVLGVSGVYVLKGHIRNNPDVPRFMASAVQPATAETAQKESPITSQPIIAANHETAQPAAAPVTAAPAAITPAPPVKAPLTAADSAKLKALAIKKAAQKKAQADSVLKAEQAAAEAKKQDSMKKAEQAQKEQQERAAAEKAAAAAKEKAKDDQPDTKKEEPKKETSLTNSDENLYKAAMQLQQQGNLNEAMDRYRQIEANSSGKYVEMARYQLAICYRSKGQMGKARRMFREVVRMDGSLKNAAQQALDTM
jgi:anti-sigma factor RsiW